MAGQHVIAPFDPAAAGADLWKRYHELRRIRQAESRPGDPIRRDDLEEQRISREDPFHIQHRYEISAGDTMLSWYYGHTVRPGTASYETNKHLYWVDVYVRPDQRRRRIGASWLALTLELAERHGCTTIGMGAEEESGHAFLRWLGADEKLKGAENRLALAEVDWAMLRRWTAEGAQRSPATRLEIHDGPLPEALWASYAPQITTMLRTMPFEGLDVGELLVTPDHLREWYTQMRLFGDEIHTVLTREPDGNISAVTEAIWSPHRETIVHQMFTGVLPEARGRGLGKWVKAAMLLHLSQTHPAARWVATDNAGSNAPMLAINKKLGFKEYRTGSDYQITRERLAARLAELKVRA
ncbi:MAG: GNAT family N-acetyltransferase [Candidatus Dormibacterales bacterium]